MKLNDLWLKDENGFVMEMAKSKARQKNHISEASSKNSIIPEGAAHLRNMSSAERLSIMCFTRTKQ